MSRLPRRHLSGLPETEQWQGVLTAATWSKWHKLLSGVPVTNQRHSQNAVWLNSVGTAWSNLCKLTCLRINNDRTAGDHHIKLPHA